jgi:hypothetical protein
MAAFTLAVFFLVRYSRDAFSKFSRQASLMENA